MMRSPFVMVASLLWCALYGSAAMAQVLCTADVKECPDGTVVSRDPANNCEFPACDSCINPVTGEVDTHVLCLVDPCSVATCDAHPDATCTANYCGGCHALFTDASGAAVDCTDVCMQPTAPGPCKAAFLRWSFDPETATCSQFVYGGCGGNGNNFESQAECEARCAPVDTCSLPADPGPCDAAFPRWAFDPVTGECAEFIYGGCLGNGNNFESRRECEAFCGLPDADGDGVEDGADKCPDTVPDATVNEAGCSGAQVVELQCGEKPGRFRGHYLWCVVRAGWAAQRTGLLSRAERREMVRAAVRR